MKRIVKLWVTAGDLVKRLPNWLEVARAAVQPLGPIDETILPAGVHFTFDYRPETLDEVKKQLRVYGFDPDSAERRQYTPKELLSAEFLSVGIEAVAHSVSKRVGEEEWEPTLRWDWELLCPYCDFFIEWWHLDALRIKTAPEGYQLARVDWTSLKVVSALLAEALRGSYSGLELVPVKGQEPSAWYVIRATHILPAMVVPPTRMNRSDRATPQCVLDHAWSNPDSEFFYRREGFKAMDFNYVYEIFGGTTRAADGSIAGATGRYLVISSRVYQLLRQLKVPKLVYEPIRFMEAGHAGDEDD